MFCNCQILIFTRNLLTYRKSWPCCPKPPAKILQPLINPLCVNLQNTGKRQELISCFTMDPFYLYFKQSWAFTEPVNTYPMSTKNEQEEPYYTPHLIDNILGLTRHKEFPRNSNKIRRREDDEKKTRTSFTPSQISRLEHDFIQKKYLTSVERLELANELGLSQQQVQIIS